MPARGQDLNWIDLTDFTPGIQSGWHTGGGAESGKDGTAQIDGTYACVASPNGGLEGAPQADGFAFTGLPSGPLSDTYTNAGIPGTHRVHDLRVQPLWHGTVTGGNYTDGDPSHNALGTEAILLSLEFFTNANIGPAGANALGRRHSLLLNDLMSSTLITIANSNGGVALYTDQKSTQFTWAHIAMIYSAYGATPNPEAPGSPFTAWMWAAQNVNGTPAVPDATMKTVVQFYPDPTSGTQPNTSTYVEPANAGYAWSTYGKMIAHNDRIVLTAALIPLTGYASNYTRWGPGETKADDTLFFHGINNVQDVTSTNIVQLTSDIIDGVGAMASGPANQLYVVRNHDGGLIISGSMESPQIDRFPGVEPTGGYTCKPCNTPLGIVYGTASGVFVWPGGDHSTQLGHGLEGPFWLTQHQWLPNGPVIDLQGRAHRQPHTSAGTFAYRAPYIYCPNNWIYDTRTGGWFRLYQPELTTTSTTEDRTGFDAITLGHFAVGYQGKVYGAQSEIRRQIRGDGQDSYHAGLSYVTFDPNKAAGQWKWTSQPLVRGRNRILKVREFDVVTSGTGTLAVTVTGINGATQTRTLTLTTDTQSQRAIFDVDCSDVTVSFHANGTNIRLHRASLGFREFTSTNAT